MPRQKGTGTKSKMSISIDADIKAKLDERFGNSREKSQFINLILQDHLASYFLMIDAGDLVFPVKKAVPVAGEEPEIIIELTKNREVLREKLGF